MKIFEVGEVEEAVESTDSLELSQTDHSAMTECSPSAARLLRNQSGLPLPVAFYL